MGMFATSDGVSDKKNTALFFIICFSALLAFMVWINWYALLRVVFVEGDIASDILHMYTAEDKLLLTGHYSRFGFMHPGPFLLYCNFVADKLFGTMLPGPFNTMVLSIITVNSLFLASAGTAVFQMFSNKRDQWFCALLFVFVSMLLLGGAMADQWMPYRATVPLLSFVVILIPLSFGRIGYLPLACLLTGALVHNYVVMPLFTIPALLVAASWCLVSRKCKGQAMLPLVPVGLALLVTTLFVLPLALDLYWNSPSNVELIFAFAAKSVGMAKAGFRASAAFVLEVLKIHGSLYPWLVLLPVTILMSVRFRELRRGLLFLGLTLVLAVGYYSTAPSPLMTFMGGFLLGPTVGIGCLGVAFLMIWLCDCFAVKQRTEVSLVVLTLAAAVLVAPYANLKNAYPGMPAVGTFTHAIRDQMSGESGPVVVHYKDFKNNWHIGLGMALELQRLEIHACIDPALVPACPVKYRCKDLLGIRFVIGMKGETVKGRPIAEVGNRTLYRMP